MKRIYIHIIFIAFFAFQFGSFVQAQDFHFSQFFNAPVIVNPALTGKYSEDFRLSLIHRSQWKQINTPYTTSAVSGDINFVKLPVSLDKVGLGFYLMNDELGDGIFKNQSAMLSIAVHKAIDPFKRHVISGGLQGGYIRKNVDKSGLTFRDQIENFETTSNPTRDGVMSGVNFGYLSFNAGVSWSYSVNDKLNVYSGASVSNANTPKERLFITEHSNLRRRYFLTFGGKYQLTDKVAILPSLMYMTQSRARDFNLGTTLMYFFNEKKDVAIQGGIYYRATDASILYGGLKIKNYHVAISYDASVSGLRKVRENMDVNDNVRVGAFEISISYVGFLKRAIPNDLTIPCRFF